MVRAQSVAVEVLLALVIRALLASIAPILGHSTPAARLFGVAFLLSLLAQSRRQ